MTQSEDPRDLGVVNAPSHLESMAWLIDLVSTGGIPRDSTVLYAHLDGQPALNAFAGIFD
jgi:hypothetical protein